MYTYEIIQHMDSGRLYFAASAPSGGINAISDEINQTDAAAITPDAETWPDWSSVEDLGWAAEQSWRSIRIISQGEGL